MPWKFEIHEKGHVPELFSWITTKFEGFDPTVRASAKIGVADALEDKARAIIIYNPSHAGKTPPAPPEGATIVVAESGISVDEIKVAAQKCVDTLNGFGDDSPSGFYAKFSYSDGKFQSARLILCWQGLTDEEV